MLLLAFGACKEHSLTFIGTPQLQCSIAHFIIATLWTCSFYNWTIGTFFFFGHVLRFWVRIKWNGEISLHITEYYKRKKRQNIQIVCSKITALCFVHTWGKNWTTKDYLQVANRSGNYNILHCRLLVDMVKLSHNLDKIPVLFLLFPLFFFCYILWFIVHLEHALATQVNRHYSLRICQQRWKRAFTKDWEAKKNCSICQFRTKRISFISTIKDGVT